MNCDSCELPKNSLIAATTGRMFTRALGVADSVGMVLMRSLATLSSLTRPMRNWF